MDLTRREMVGLLAAASLPAAELAAADAADRSAHQGETYEVEVPDTLDLAERCRLALHGLAGQTDPNCYYQQWFAVRYAVRAPYMSHNAADGTCTPKFAESFPLLRTVCGSREYLDIETRQMEHLLANISPDDGLYYNVWKPDRPWHSVYMPGKFADKQEDYAAMVAQGRMMRAMILLRERDGDQRWDDRLRAMALGLTKIAIYRNDYAYYPDGGHGHQYTHPRSGWVNTREPQSGTESGEGSVTDSQVHPVYGLMRWYEISGDKEALELARKLTNFTMLPKLWGGLAEEISVKGAEQGHFHSHNHGNMAGLRGILEYGRVVQNPRVLELVRRSYEHIRTYMIPRIGWYPSNGVGEGGFAAEACNLGDQIALGIRLTDAGVGDYWEDVDAVVRNLLMEQQLTDVEKLRAVAAASPKHCEASRWPGQETTENLPDRIVGVFASFAAGNSLPPSTIMGCCSGNATQGLYYAWEGALREDGDAAQVNLLINRASRLADVDSYLPYEGQVVIHNKRARRVSVRILSWIDRRELRVTVSGQSRPLRWVGSYLVVDDLKPTDNIVLTFPVPESRASCTAHHRVWRRERLFTYKFRGSTVTEVSPKETSPLNIPIYDRGPMRGPAPMKRVARYVPERPLLQW